MGLLRGEMELRRGDEGISLRPEGLVEVALRVRCKGEREMVAVELRWLRGEAGPTEPGRPEPVQAESAVFSREQLMRLGKHRLYAVAKELEIPGRSGLPKVGLARVLAGRELGGVLSEGDLLVLSE